MKIDTMRKVDYFAGVPLCFVSTLFLRLGRALTGKAACAPKNVLFVELSEMGSAILADPAMRKIRRARGAELHFVIFESNAASLRLLGTVPEGFRARLEGGGLHGCAVMQFEGGPQGFRRPADYAECSLAAFGTHDTPTLAGWWAARDVDLRTALGHLTPEEAAAARAERAAARAALIRRLRDDGLAPPGLDPEAPPETMDPALRDAIHAALGGAASALVAVQLDDALGALDPQNVPGTVAEQPNWRRRHRVAPEAMAADPDLRALCAVMARARPREAAAPPPSGTDGGPGIGSGRAR